MNAPPLPVLSLWAADASAFCEPRANVPEAMARVAGMAKDPVQALDNAAREYPGRDVLLLRLDAELPEGSWRALASAWENGGWDVLSPLDGACPLFPADVDTASRNAMAWRLAPHASFAHAGWSSVCSVWRASALAKCDAASVLHCGLLPCAYAGPALAASDAELPPPLAQIRSRIAAATQPSGVRTAAAPALLHVLHGWGGGVDQFARDLAAADPGRQHLLLVPSGHDHFQPYGRRLNLHLDLDSDPVATWQLASPIGTTATASPEVAGILAEIIAQWGVGSVLVSSLIGHALDVLRTGRPTAFCVHDNYPAWPLLHDTRDPTRHPFDIDALTAGMAQAGPDFVLAGRSAAQWWTVREAFIEALADAEATLVAPSEFARRRLCAIAPVLGERDWRVIPHGLAPFTATAITRSANPAGQPLRVLVLGRIQGDKGERLLTPLLELLPQGIELLLLGSGNAGARFEGKAGIQVVRDYERDDLPARIEELSPDLVLLPSTVPETFSYTLSEMLSLRVPVLCASPGAAAERLLAMGGGWVVDACPAAVCRQLEHLAAHRNEIAAIAALPAPKQTTLETMGAEWRKVLPHVTVPLRLSAATPSLLANLGAQADALALRESLASSDEALADARAELDRRADWAHDLQCQLEQAQAERKRQEEQLERDLAEARSTSARLEDHIHEMDHQLAEAHGYYQRDSTDLIKQRDVALHQRNQAQSRLDAIQASVTWRIAALPRRLMEGLRNLVLANVYRVRHYSQLASRGLSSLRSRGAAGTWRRFVEMRASRPQAPRVAPTAEPRAADSAFRLPRPQHPRASIIVPVYNQLHYTLACLRSLSDCGDGTAFEVIVIDDASTDASPRVLPSIPGLHYQRNPSNLGFIGACNAGAELASGEFVVFLNNDTTVSPGWLDALLETFAMYPDTGLAGSKLVYPDGRLQEAGGIVFADGSGWNYGRFENPAHPRFNFVREVDYCSGASIALRRDLFLQLGGFDSHYAPAYYEDTDLAMRIRAAGLKVRYQPASLVVHHEGISSGTDLQSGVKAYQVTNHRKFLERWRSELTASHQPPGSDPEVASERGRGRRVLVMDACTPTPDKDSGSVRMLALMQALRDEGCSVVFFPQNLAHDGAYTHAVQQLGVEAWWHPFLTGVPAWLHQHGPRLDLVIGSRHYVLSPTLPLLRKHAPGAYVVFDTVDLHHLRELREAEVSGEPGQLRNAARTRRIELDLIAQCDSTWVVSGAEQALLAEEIPAAKVDVVSNIHVVHGPGKPWAERSDLLFVGGYRHTPNVDAALWLARDIFPLIRARLPGVVLNLVGAEAPPAVVALGELPGVTVHGFVPDLAPLLEGTRVGLAPLRFGAGVKGKVNHSLAHGQPMVATLCAVEGMHLVDGEDVLVADDAEAFAAAVVRLYEDQALWEMLSAGGLENTRRHFSPAAVRATLHTLLASLPGR